MDSDGVCKWEVKTDVAQVSVILVGVTLNTCRNCLEKTVKIWSAKFESEDAGAK
jgi:hypothetical protein